jgi:hypothetical protein
MHTQGDGKAKLNASQQNGVRVQLSFPVCKEPGDDSQAKQPDTSHPCNYSQRGLRVGNKVEQLDREAKDQILPKGMPAASSLMRLNKAAGSSHPIKSCTEGSDDALV